MQCTISYKALIVKHLIVIINPSSTSLWAERVKKMIVKDMSFWQIHKPSKCSWIFKKVLGARDMVRQFISYVIGDERHISFWFDPWLNGHPICESRNDQAISQYGLPKNAKVVAVLSSEGWNLPVTNHHTMLAWRQSFPLPHHYDLRGKDDIQWDGKASRNLKVSEFYKASQSVNSLGSC